MGEDLFYRLEATPPVITHRATIGRATDLPKEKKTVKNSEALAAALAQALAKEARIAEAYGDDLPDGSVIAFLARFTPGGTKFKYSAIRCEGRWYTTGPRSPKSYTWDELTEWFESLDKVSKFGVLRTGDK